MNKCYPRVKWPEILRKIELSGYKTSYIVSQLNTSQPYLYQMLHGTRPMPDSVKERLEIFFDCTFERPSPEPEKEAT